MVELYVHSSVGLNFQSNKINVITDSQYCPPVETNYVGDGSYFLVFTKIRLIIPINECHL